jgi:hypothetical protein
MSWVDSENVDADSHNHSPRDSHDHSPTPGATVFQFLNRFYHLANGETVSSDRMQELIAKADGEKREKAFGRLQSQAKEGLHDHDVDNDIAAERMAGAWVPNAAAGDHARHGGNDGGLVSPAEVPMGADRAALHPRKIKS